MLYASSPFPAVVEEEQETSRVSVMLVVFVCVHAVPVVASSCMPTVCSQGYAFDIGLSNIFSFIVA